MRPTVVCEHLGTGKGYALTFLIAARPRQPRPGGRSPPPLMPAAAPPGPSATKGDLSWISY